MPPRYVSGEADLPDHDLILELPEELVYHVRHYLHRATHVVVVGQLEEGGSPSVNAVQVARKVAETVVPAGQPFTMIAYAPQSPLSAEPHFREVTFEVDDRGCRPSAELLSGPKLPRPRTAPLALSSVEELAGRPVLRFPYRFYTRPLAEAMNGQPAKRLFELLIEAGLVCPLHGPSPYGEYCGTDTSCQQERNRRVRRWRSPYAPRRRGLDGCYRGDTAHWPAQIELATALISEPLPVHGLDAPEVSWGYAGAGPQEAATTILADYLGFLPRPELRVRFKSEVVSQLHADAFTLAVAELDRWFEGASEPRRRGLVVVAGPATPSWSLGHTSATGAWIGQALVAAGFEVYEPARNGEAPPWRLAQRPLQGMLHASLLAALQCCSMIVIPYDGEALTQCVESVSALRYALEREDVPALIVYDRADGGDFSRYETFGISAVRVQPGSTALWDVQAVVEAVDRECAAQECLRQPAA